MKSNLVACLKALFFCLALVTMFPFAEKTARADNVTFTTSGSFNGGGNSISFGSGGNTLTLTFVFNQGLGPVTLNAGPPGTTASFGEVVASTSGSGAAIAPGTTLTITINQTGPSGGTTTFTGNLNTGTITQTSSSGQLTFPAGQVGPFAINGVTTYQILFPNPLSLVPPVTNNGRTSVQGGIVTLVPEPTSMFLFATGLSGIVSLRRRWARRH